MSNWNQNVSFCLQRHRSIMELLNQRDLFPPSSRATQELTEQIESLAKQFAKDIKGLEMELDRLGANSVLTPGELSRRQEDLNGLKNQEKRVRVQLRPLEARHNLLLFDGEGLDDMGAVGWDDPAQSEPTEAPEGAQLKESHREILKAQDSGLDALHEVIVRQKHLAGAIGGEVEIQNELLDDIGDNMDETRQRLIDTTQGMRGLGRRDRTWGYWIVIIVLFIAIIIVASLKKHS